MAGPFPTQPAIAAVRAARVRLSPYIQQTPVLRLVRPDSMGDCFVKLENLQPTGVYKVRSIGHAVLQTPAETMARGVYTASSGNAGIGLAWIARELGIPARIYAPGSAPDDKLDRAAALGASIFTLPEADWWRVIVDGDHSGDPGRYVDAVRDPEALAGNGTIALELVEQLPDVRNVVIPFGGGGIACGIASALRQLKPDVRIIVAESDAATPVSAALSAGRPVTVPHADSFISGAGAPIVLPEMWPLVRDLIDDTIVSPVSAVEDAVRLLFERQKVVAEGAGALSVAAVLGPARPRGTTACLVTGGNIGWDVMAKILAANSRAGT